MFLTLAFHHYILKWLIPASYVVLTIPSYILSWSALKLACIPLPKRASLLVDNFLFELYFKQLLYFLLKINPLKVYFHGETLDIFKRRENIIAICNHQSDIDWLIVSAIANEQNRFGCMRFVLNKKYENVPILGFFLKMRKFVFNRANKNDSNFRELISSFKKIENPIWFLIFPENKRYNMKSKEILALNRKFSVEHKLPEFTHVLIPKIEITHTALCCLMPRLDAIYDITIAYRNTKTLDSEIEEPQVPSFNDLLGGNTYEMHVHTKRIAKEELIKTDLHEFDINSRDKTAQFLINLFYKKDKNMDIFYRNDLKCQNEMANAANLCSHNLSFISVLPGALFFSTGTFFMLYSKLGRSIFIKTYAYTSILTFVLIKANSYLKKKKNVIFTQ